MGIREAAEIGLHLLGNLFSSRQHGENLTLSMITGDKRPQ